MDKYQQVCYSPILGKSQARDVKSDEWCCEVQVIWPDIDLTIFDIDEIKSALIRCIKFPIFMSSIFNKLKIRNKIVLTRYEIQKKYFFRTWWLSSMPNQLAGVCFFRYKSNSRRLVCVVCSKYGFAISGRAMYITTRQYTTAFRRAACSEDH